MKAIVLTYAEITKEEEKLLKNTDIFKIACNDYCAELRPNVRLCVDNIVDKCLKCDSCDVISTIYDLEKDRVINACTMPSRNSSLLSCIDWLYFQGYSNVLLVADNTQCDHTTIKADLQKNVYNTVDFMKDCLNLYKYTDKGVFNIPTMTIKEFIMLTDEEKLLGITEKSPRKLIEKTIFTDACRYEVHTEGKDNKSIEGGHLIDSLLPLNEKQRLLNGETEITYNGLVIKKLTVLEPVKKAEKEPAADVKPVAKKTVKKKVKKG